MDPKRNVVLEADKALAAERAAKKERLREVREAWVRKFGSARLQKALATGLLGQSLGVYRDERLALELPLWEWKKGRKQGEILNPSEDALDLLLHLRECGLFPDDAHLVSVRDDDDGWREAVAVDFPFADDEEVPDVALLFVEAKEK